ncbi:MAG: hypothetical protein AAB461_00795 [Patescibacteria group bacterium]
MVSFKNSLKNLFSVNSVKWAGRIAIIGWIIFGIFYLYCAANISAIPAPVEQQLTPTVVQPPTPRWESRDECERYYALTLHQAPGNRCN